MRFRTLVVENDEPTRDRVASVLRSHGHVVVAMTDADAAFAAHRRNPYDLMVVDWRLPGAMSGIDLLRKVRDLPGGDLVSVLMLTPKSDAADVDRVLDAGATDYLVKPFDDAAIRRRIRLAERNATVLARRHDEASDDAKVRAQLLMADRLASMGTLAAGVAHEINNPLASLTANLEFIAEYVADSDDPDIREALIDAQSSAERVGDIIGALSRFARAESSDTGPVDVEATMDTIAKVLSNEIRHKARLVRAYGGVTPALADEGRLGQVFLNLLKNAADELRIGHSEEHEIRIVTREEGDYVVVEVSDTGPGVDPAIAARIFDPFFTTKPVGSGVGLGLSLCHGIISGLAGTIELVQGTERGATFRVRLPKAPADAAHSSRRTPSSQLLRPVLHGKVLVVDDELLIQRSIKRTLSGHDITLASNGREALELCLVNDYDVVLCDLMMPEVSGMELYERLELARPDFIPRIIFMTGGAFTSAANDFLAQIENPHINKPFDVDELRAFVAEWVTLRRRRSED